ncbi:MAG: hypothetical protein AB1665_08105 [Candidatus Thermoplasmatota archaeon]
MALTWIPQYNRWYCYHCSNYADYLHPIATTPVETEEYKCPRCSSKIQYHMDRNDWYCANCMAYPFQMKSEEGGQSLISRGAGGVGGIESSEELVEEGDKDASKAGEEEPDEESGFSSTNETDYQYILDDWESLGFDVKELKCLLRKKDERFFKKYMTLKRQIEG